MKHLKILLPITIASLMTACISADNLQLQGVEIPTNMVFNGELSNAPHKKFLCDNGYKVAVTYYSKEQIALSFRTDKDTFVDKLYVQRSSLYANKLNNLRWQETGNTYTLFYPDSQYMTTKKVWQTACRPQ